MIILKFQKGNILTIKKSRFKIKNFKNVLKNKYHC